MPPTVRLLSLVAAALPLIAPAALAQGLCTFDEVAIRMPAENAYDWQTGHHNPTEVAPFIFAIEQFAMHSGGVRMDSPQAEGEKRYVGVSKQEDARFVWNGHVFAMPRGDGLGLADGRRILVVRRADKPVVDVMLGTCSEDGFDSGDFATEFFEAVKKQEGEAK